MMPVFLKFLKKTVSTDSLIKIRRLPSIPKTIPFSQTCLVCVDLEVLTPYVVV